MEDINVDHQWRFTIEELGKTPSGEEGMSLGKELFQRNKAIDFLFRVGNALKLPMNVLATAATYFHRFYMRYTIQDCHPFEVAGTCIFVATKIEECLRKVRDVAMCCLVKIGIQADENSREFERFQQAVLLLEGMLLEALAFDLTVDHAHAYLVSAVDELDASEDVTENAWSLCTDTLRLPLCLTHSPRVVACAVYLLALQEEHSDESDFLQKQLFESREPWREAFGVDDNDSEDIAVVIAVMVNFYATIEATVGLSKERPMRTPFQSIALPRSADAWPKLDGSAPAPPNGTSKPNANPSQDIVPTE